MAGKQPGADDDPRLPDDIWERFQNDSWGKISGSAPREPSARWYEVSSRLDSRGDEQARASEPRRRPRPRSRPRARLPEEPVRRAVAVLLIIVTVAVALSALAAYVQYGRVL